MMVYSLDELGALADLASVSGLPTTPPELAHTLTALTLTTVAVSVAANGISVTPLMSLYKQRQPGHPSASPLD